MELISKYSFKEIILKYSLAGALIMLFAWSLVYTLRNIFITYHILDTFEKMRKATSTIVMSLRPHGKTNVYEI
jgi:uncharacterized membrane protein